MDFIKLKEDMLQGWNTYYNNSVLTHVLMPYGFAISLGFKFYNTGLVLKDVYIENENIILGPRTYDGTYTELTVKSNGHEIMIQGIVIDGNQCFLITPLKIEKKPPALLVSASMLWNKPGCVQKVGDILRTVIPDAGEIEVFAKEKDLNELNTGLKDLYLSVELSKEIVVSTQKPIKIDEIKRNIKKKKALIQNELSKYKEFAETYNAMRNCLAWNTVYEPENEQICSPVNRNWSTRWGGYVLLELNTYLAGIMAAAEDKNLAYANIIAMTREKTETGFIPNFGAANGFKSRDRSHPPVGALALKEVYRIYREKWIVEYLFDDLLAWNRWWAENRCLSNGQLCWGSTPYEAKLGRSWEVAGVGDRYGAEFESGFNNSPMYNGVPFDTQTNMMKLADVGLTGMYIMDCEALAELAEIIGRPECVQLRERAEKSKDGLEEMWDEESGIYLNKRTDTGEWGSCISPTNFYALFSDRVSNERAERMIKEYFYNKNKFYGEYMIPTITRDDPKYVRQNYTEGRIFGTVNYLTYIAMRKHGLSRSCRILAEKSNELLLLEWDMNKHIHDNYNADTGMGCGFGESDKFHHGGALLALIVMMEKGYFPSPHEPVN